MNVQVDPLQSITTALSGIFTGLGFSSVILGWPDPSLFQMDNKLPLLAVYNTSSNGKHLSSRDSIHATKLNTSGLTATVYQEKLRLFYLLQLSIFAHTVEDRSNLGWIVQQYLTSNPQIPIGIPGVETSVFSFKSGPHDLSGEAKLFQRDLTFEVTARVLDAQTLVPVAKQVVLNDDTTGTDGPSTSTVGSTRIING